MPFSRGLSAVLHHLVPRRTPRTTRVYFVQSRVCFLTVVWRAERRGSKRKKKKKKRLQGNLISSPSCWSFLLLLLLLLLLLSTQYSCGSGSCSASMCTLARVCWRGTPAILMCEASTDLTFLVKESAVPLGPDCRGTLAYNSVIVLRPAHVRPTRGRYYREVLFLVLTSVHSLCHQRSEVSWSEWLVSP